MNKESDRLAKMLQEQNLSRSEFIRRAAALGLSASAMGSILTACGNNTNQSSQGQQNKSSGKWSLEQAASPYKGTTIRFIGENQNSIRAYRDIAAKQFTKKTGITVDFTLLQHPYDEQKAELDMSQGTGTYDIWNPDISDMAKAGAAGWFTPLKQFLSNKDLADPNYDLNDFFSDDLEFVGKYKGELVAIPADHVVMLYVYNKKRLSKAGFKPPKTWDQFEAISKHFTSGGDYGLATGLGRNPEVLWEFMGYLFNFGGEPMSKEDTGKPTIDTPAARKMLKYWKHLADNYAPPGAKEWDATNVFDSLSAGNTTHAIFWTDTIDLVYEDSQSSKVVGEMAYDVPPESGWGHSGSSSLCVPNTSQQKEAAWLFIQFATSKEMLMQGPPFAPARKSFYKSAKTKSPDRYNSYLKTILKLNGHAKSRPLVPQWDSMKESMMRNLNSVFTDQMSVESGLKSIQSEWEQAMNNSG